MSIADEIAVKLVELVPSDVQADLAAEDTATAVELHFAPVHTRSLPSVPSFGDPCSVDGYYDPYIDPKHPWIFYSDSLAAARARFTILHELGHHLFNERAAHLLDDVDRAAAVDGDPHAIEERVCQSFAGRMLVSEALLAAVVGSATLTPQHIVELHDRSNASWDAVAVRAAERIVGSGAVVLIDGAGSVRYCAATGGPAKRGWRRGSATNSAGPLHQAASESRTARPETYRWGLPYSEHLFCDTLPVHDNLGIGLLTSRASDRHVEILEEPEPAWRRPDFCERCSEERTEGWCDTCKGRLCPICGRCRCDRVPKSNRLCSDCGLTKPHRPGAPACKDCEDS